MTNSQEERIAVLQGRVAAAVGQLVLAFGQMETVTYLAINRLCDEPTLARLASRDWQFEQRRALVLKVIKKRNVPLELSAAWDAGWRRVKELAEHRNHAAHGQISTNATILGEAPEQVVPDEQLVGAISIKRMLGGREDFTKAISEIEDLVRETSALGSHLMQLVELNKCPWRDRLLAESQWRNAKS